ncbi:hypothetical protein [Paenibacillus sedimenti]|uniref:Uncharacterized protein n=1 Tax=Paenibacillus sedimenti TaxID=2770274 RepID=A0A926KRZ1_9BACL|nr:hypothetical protein [Paenibacillus sedimenti]MBD0383012.1 hypothetical protein [Paenibacillus sedimenti]
MWTIAGILIAAALIVIIEVPALWRKKWIKEIWVHAILLLIGTGLSIALSLRVKIPNPLDWITFVYKPFSDLLANWLK